MDTTIVIFRWEREGGVFALFPELPADNQGFYLPATSTSASIVPLTTTAASPTVARPSPANTADLFNELEGRGYNLIIRQRATPVMHERRRFQAIL